MPDRAFNVLFLCTGCPLDPRRKHPAQGWRRTLQCLFRRKPPQGPRQSPRAENTRSLRVTGRGISLEERPPDFYDWPETERDGWYAINGGGLELGGCPKDFW